MLTNLHEINLEDDVERLIILRNRLNLNQFQFAKELGLSASYLTKVERRVVTFTPTLREKINDYLKQEHLIYEKSSNLYK